MSPTPVTATDLTRRLDDPALRILDVRSGAEFETAHIPGSYNVPLDSLAEHVRELADAAGPMVVVCQSGNRAKQACTRLAGAGKQDLLILDGGIASWEKAGGKVIRGEQRWALERQVRLVAGSLVLGSVLVSTVAPRAKWLAGAVGAGLTFSAVSNTCAMGNLLSRLPYNRTSTADIDQVVAQLRAA